MPDRPRGIYADPVKVAAIRASLGLDTDNLPLNLTPQEREAALTPQEPQMPDVPVPAPVLLNPKTPVLADKRLAVAIATVIALLLAAFLKIEVPVETIAAVVAVVLGYVTNSALKEAAVSKAIAANQAPQQS